MADCAAEKNCWLNTAPATADLLACGWAAGVMSRR